MRGALICILLLAQISPAGAADWIALSIPRTEDRYFYDRSKLVVDGDDVTYWKKALFKPPRPVKNQLAHSALMRERINCHEHTLRLLSYLYYDVHGTVIEYVTEAEKQGDPIIPETVGDRFEQALCALPKESDSHPARDASKIDAHAF